MSPSLLLSVADLDIKSAAASHLQSVFSTLIHQRESIESLGPGGLILFPDDARVFFATYENFRTDHTEFIRKFPGASVTIPAFTSMRCFHRQLLYLADGLDIPDLDENLIDELQSEKVKAVRLSMGARVLAAEKGLHGGVHLVADHETLHKDLSNDTQWIVDFTVVPSVELQVVMTMTHSLCQRLWTLQELFNEFVTRPDEAFPKSMVTHYRTFLRIKRTFFELDADIIKSFFREKPREVYGVRLQALMLKLSHLAQQMEPDGWETSVVACLKQRSIDRWRNHPEFGKLGGFQLEEDLFDDASNN